MQKSKHLLLFLFLLFLGILGIPLLLDYGSSNAVQITYTVLSYPSSTIGSLLQNTDFLQ
jgi:hypothetical protein